jgi:hypothetical protein
MSTNDFGFSIPQDQVKEPDPNLPDGNYPFKLVETERKVSQADARNWFFKCSFEVIAGPAAGRKHFQNFNIGHTTESVKSMALSDLKKLATAIGYVGDLNSFAPFMQKPFCGTIKNKPRKDDADKTNSNIVKWENISTYSTAPSVTVAPSIASVVPAVAAVALPSTPAANTAAPAAAPWGAKAA